MESLELIKSRIQSIENTRQITQSMRLLSTSRVHRARERMTMNLPFLEGTERLMRVSAANVSDPGNPYLNEAKVKRAAVIIINGDRGLCGGYNINVNRHAAALIRSLGGDVKIITAGIKSRDFCRRRYKNMLEHSFTGVSESPSGDDAKAIAEIVLDWYNSGQVGSIYAVYTKFESMLVQTPIEKRLLPLNQYAGQDEAPVKDIVRLEPDGAAFLARAVSFYISASLLGAMLESSVSELSARISSMDAAVKNADEMIDGLTLTYNQARQGAITQEIVEIVSGADAV